MAFQQTVIRYNNGNGKKVRDVVKHFNADGSPGEIKHGKLPNGAGYVCYEKQSNGDIHLLGKSLIIEIFVEEEDPTYGTFRKIHNIDF